MPPEYGCRLSLLNVWKDFDVVCNHHTEFVPVFYSGAEAFAVQRHKIVGRCVGGNVHRLPRRYSFPRSLPDGSIYVRSWKYVDEFMLRQARVSLLFLRRPQLVDKDI